MIKLSLIITCATVVYSMKSGTPAHLREFAYIVSVQRSNLHVSSGVIINAFHVMTVAHMISTASLQELRIKSAMNTVIAPRTVYRNIKEVFIHPGFRVHFERHGETYDNDIALLRLREQINWTPTVAPVSFDITEYNWNDPVDCFLISWDTGRNRKLAEFLVWEFIKVISGPMHPEWVMFLGDHKKLFNDYFGAVIIDEDDLGSPIVCGNLMQGLVVQFKRAAAEKKAPVLMSIAPYLEFIQTIVQDGLFHVESSKYPYIASIWSGNTQVCGGFILDPIRIGTAGHCVVHEEALNYTVAVGFPETLTQWLSIHHIGIHSGYKIQSTHQTPTWYIDHDFAIITLEQRISWNEGVKPIVLSTSRIFSEGQICELLRWKSVGDRISGVDAIKLMSSRVVLMDECFQLLLDPSNQSQVPSFWGKSLYTTPIADSRDVGNPLICHGYLIGFLVQAVPINGDSSATAAKFLKIHPYLGLHSNILN